MKSLNGMAVYDGSKLTLDDYILDLMVDATVVEVMMIVTVTTATTTATATTKKLVLLEVRKMQ